MKTSAVQWARWATTIVGAASLVMAACGGEDQTGGVNQDASNGGPQLDAISFDSSGGEDTGATEDDDTSAAPDGDAGSEGRFGSSCEDDSDCDSAWCVATPDGFQCSKTCLESCPDPLRCRGVTRSTGGVTFICVHPTAALCHPCDANEECNLGVANEANLCVSYGDEGGFCGTACADDGECPDGYGCEDVTTVDGDAGRQCVPDAGMCTCNGSAAALERSTSCRFTNEFGTCGARRACTEDGLEACTGDGAAPEVCNGEDDDCDGVIDEDVPGSPCAIDNEHGSCPGTTSCVDAEETCVGTPPEAEACNGRDDDCDGETDEGFVDTDDDGVADCVDPDRDGDGTPNGADCAPLDPTIYPGAPEVCDEVDRDCSGAPDDEGAEGCDDYRQDHDGDGFGSDAAPVRCLCGPDEDSDYTVPASDGGDCDDYAASVYPDAPEACDFVDNDCDGDTDEGVASPCGGCSPICVFDVGGEASPPLSQDPEGQQNLVSTPDGGLRLESGQVEIPFIWIANSPEGTVSKLDTSNGDEVARYSICSDPSRTAVDLQSNGIVTCRGDGRVAKIAILETDCIDKNDNGVIDTSRDADGDGRISVTERVANDECILWNVQPDGSPTSGCGSGGNGCARAGGVDADNNVWVGFWRSQRLRKLDGSTGEVLDTVPLSGRPYGLAIAGDGVIWVAERSPDFGLIAVHPQDGEIGAYEIPGGRQVYGMAIDHAGRIWAATGTHEGLSRFDPETESWEHLGPWESRGGTRGLAVRLLTDGDNNVIGSTVYAAHHTWSGGCNSNDGEHRTVTVVDAASATEQGTLDLGADRGPVGVAIDVAGDLWTVNQCTNDATKFALDNGERVGSFPVGSSPYTYSDMTGYALRTITAPSGFHREVFEGWATGETRWSAIFVDAQLPGNGTTFVRLRYRAAASEGDLSGTPWSPGAGPFPPEPLPHEIDATGRFIEVEVSLHTSDNNVIPVLYGVSAIAEQR